MPKEHDEIKSIKELIAEIGVNSFLTPTDKLVAVTVVATGEMNPAVLMEMLGLKRSTLYRSLGNAWEFAADTIEKSVNPIGGNAETPETDGKQTEIPSHQWEKDDWHGDCTSRAPKELPNGNTSYEDTSMHACSAHAGEIEGLNGSTGAFTTQLATLLAGPLGSPDFQTAKQILESNVRSFGAERVRIAMAEWSVRVQTDRQFRATPSSFGKFVQAAKTTGNVVDFEPDWKRKRREQSARIDAMLEALPQ